MLIEPAQRAALRRGCPLVSLVEIDHPDGLINLWSGVGTLIYDGKSWKGAGSLGQIEAGEKTTELRIDEIRLSLSGIDAGDLQDVGTDIRNRTATTWSAILGEDRKIVGTPHIQDEILLDYAEQEMADDGTVTLTLVGQTGFWTLERSTESAWSPEEAILRFGRTGDAPNETGFDYIVQLKMKDTKWGLT